ncbi:hypothetical protein BDZ94DRAFT_1260245 [Collybia nuda]|uniref:Uncharacterized protein n=1 Tax=Collybia nuda TaxID=64659 RepID=A0A9P6CEK1_9AGAR|nr:hypothetical protein BDZ94DRAFT_1260245 [Collybia nuda]
MRQNDEYAVTLSSLGVLIVLTCRIQACLYQTSKQYIADPGSHRYCSKILFTHH